MKRKYLQVDIPDELRVKIDEYVEKNKTSTKEFSKRSFNVYLSIFKYMDEGYRIYARDESGKEKEIVFL